MPFQSLSTHAFIVEWNTRRPLFSCNFRKVFIINYSYSTTNSHQINANINHFNSYFPSLDGQVGNLKVQEFQILGDGFDSVFGFVISGCQVVVDDFCNGTFRISFFFMREFVSSLTPAIWVTSPTCSVFRKTQIPLMQNSATRRSVCPLGSFDLVTNIVVDGARSANACGGLWTTSKGLKKILHPFLHPHAIEI